MGNRNVFGADTITVGEYTFKVTYEYDESSDAPWDDACGHGPVRSAHGAHKRPGERKLNENWLYDWQEACRMARHDWGVKDVASAVQANFDFLKAWVDDEWCYVGVIVEHEPTGEEESLWGVETHNDYHETIAMELATTLFNRLEEERIERGYWAERDVVTEGV